MIHMEIGAMLQNSAFALWYKVEPKVIYDGKLGVAIQNFTLRNSKTTSLR